MRVIEGRDFYREGSYRVWTREYLLNRGTCCGSGCRHGPYPQCLAQKSATHRDDQNVAFGSQGPRVVSMVPSWTETLIHAGLNLVGRTRFCVHPQDMVIHVPIWGGTKSFSREPLSWEECDFVLLDKEENTREMADLVPSDRLLITHVRDLRTLHQELTKLSVLFHNSVLAAMALRLEQSLRRLSAVAQDSDRSSIFRRLEQLQVIEWWRKPGSLESLSSVTYVIWSQPWMSVSSETFIGDVLQILGVVTSERVLWSPESTSDFCGKYPSWSLDQLPRDSLVLLSSEPFPFARKKDEILSLLPQPAIAFVDGELFSWFGLRSLRFLENMSLV